MEEKTKIILLINEKQEQKRVGIKTMDDLFTIIMEHSLILFYEFSCAV